MSISQWDLYREGESNFTKTIIATCAPKRWCYVYVIIVYVLTVYVKSLSIICPCISLLLNFNDL